MLGFQHTFYIKKLVFSTVLVVTKQVFFFNGTPNSVQTTSCELDSRRLCQLQPHCQDCQYVNIMNSFCVEWFNYASVVLEVNYQILICSFQLLSVSHCTWSHSHPHLKTHLSSENYFLKSNFWLLPIATSARMFVKSTLQMVITCH